METTVSDFCAVVWLLGWVLSILWWIVSYLLWAVLWLLLPFALVAFVALRVAEKVLGPDMVRALGQKAIAEIRRRAPGSARGALHSRSARCRCACSAGSSSIRSGTA